MSFPPISQLIIAKIASNQFDSRQLFHNIKTRTRESNARFESDQKPKPKVIL